MEGTVLLAVQEMEEGLVATGPFNGRSELIEIENEEDLISTTWGGFRWVRCTVVGGKTLGAPITNHRHDSCIWFGSIAGHHPIPADTSSAEGM